MKRPERFLLLAWTLVTGFVAFAAYVCWDRALIQVMVSTDQSKISVLIMSIYVIGVAHSFIRALYLAREMDVADATAAFLRGRPTERLAVVNGRVVASGGNAMPGGFVASYVTDLQRALRTSTSAPEAPESRTELLNAYSAKIRGAHDIGWFIVDLMLKLGFLGTVIGFIIMLSSVAAAADIDVSVMQKVLKQMSFGMGTALYTTLCGLVCGILLAIHYHLLDRGLDELVENTVYLTEVEVLPRLTAAQA